MSALSIKAPALRGPPSRSTHGAAMYSPGRTAVARGASIGVAVSWTTVGMSAIGSATGTGTADVESNAGLAGTVAAAGGNDVESAGAVGAATATTFAWSPGSFSCS